MHSGLSHYVLVPTRRTLVSRPSFRLLFLRNGRMVLALSMQRRLPVLKLHGWRECVP